MTALMHAACCGHEDILKILIKAGANFDLEDRFSNSALTFAVKNEKSSIVKFLLDFGVRPSYQYNLFWAREIGSRTIEQILLEHDSPKSCCSIL